MKIFIPLMIFLVILTGCTASTVPASNTSASNVAQTPAPVHHTAATSSTGTNPPAAVRTSVSSY